MSDTPSRGVRIKMPADWRYRRLKPSKKRNVGPRRLCAFPGCGTVLNHLRRETERFCSIHWHMEKARNEEAETPP